MAITSFCGMAPKTYLYTLADGGYVVKAKGLCMTLENKDLTTPAAVKDLIKLKVFEMTEDYSEKFPNESYAIILKHFTIFSNTNSALYVYGTLFFRYSVKIECCYSKKNDCTCVCP